MFCKQCRKSIPDDSSFCMHCGAALANRQPDADIEQIPVESFTASQTAVLIDPADGMNSPHNIQAVRKKSKAAIVFAVISMLLAAALLLSFLNILPSPFGAPTAASGSVFASRSFDTPEEAIESFVEYLKAGDYDGALSATTAETFFNAFDYRKYTEHMQGLWPVGKTYLPADYPQFIEYNRYKYTNDMLEKMIVFSATLTLSEENAGDIKTASGSPRRRKHAMLICAI